jgi:ATP-binding cassette subfamily B protein
LLTYEPSSYVPLAVQSLYEPPKASIDPDRSKTWLRRALPILFAHKRIFIVSMVLSFVGLLLQVQIPDFMNKAISNSIESHRVSLDFYVDGILLFSVLGTIAGYISRQYLYQVAYNIEFDLRNIVFEHLSRMSFPFYDRVQTGQLISRANSDIRQVQMYLAFGPSIMVQFGIAFVAFGYMLSINVPLAFVAMASMPIVFIAGTRMRKAMFPVSWLIQARLAEVATIVDENVNGVRVVKSFVAEPSQLRSLAKAADGVQWGYVKDADLRARFTPQTQNAPRLGLALVLLFGGYMAIHGHVGIGVILAFNAYLLMLQAPFQMLGMIIMMAQRAAASSERIYEIIDEEPTIVDRPGAIDLVDCQGDVRFDSVDFRYTDDGPAILRDFDLHLRPGETVAVVGRTGSGKSTVSRILGRFYDVSGGAVRIDGHNVKDLTLPSLRANVGMVLDEPFLFSVSLRDNIAFGKPTATMEEIVAAATAAGADEFINALTDGYDTVVGERGYTLSGGQRQRIAIARTLLVNPPILILDDATSAIDVGVEQQIHSALKNLMGGRTTLIIAHRLSTISLADRVVLIEDGRVVADGTHEHLMATVPLYAQVLAQGESPNGSGPGSEPDGGLIPDASQAGTTTSAQPVPGVPHTTDPMAP